MPQIGVAGWNPHQEVVVEKKKDFNYAFEHLTTYEERSIKRVVDHARIAGNACQTEADIASELIRLANIALCHIVQGEKVL